MSSNVYPWQWLKEKTKAEIRVVQCPPGGSWTSAVIQALDSEVRLVAIPECRWTDGARIDLIEVKRAMPPNALLVVDATQSLGAVPSNVVTMGCDFLCASVHKWLFGPYGASFFYAKERFVDEFEPIDHHEHNREGCWDDACLPFLLSEPGYSTKFKPGMRKFDAGGRPNPILMHMIQDAMKQVLLWKNKNIADYVRPLMTALVKGAHELGIRTPTEHAAHLCGLQHARFTEDCVDHLKTLGIIVSWRSSSIRVSLHVFNTMEDIDALLQGLRDWLTSCS
eukprot:GEMP01063362.1.p1 GENE.GEMP01063362.1~~GEMP01063362.1.p1  ORF type:complete len:280 (-),score=45.95 GEMP01063362.1:239-1078(-)